MKTLKLYSKQDQRDFINPPSYFEEQLHEILMRIWINRKFLNNIDLETLQYFTTKGLIDSTNECKKMTVIEKLKELCDKEEYFSPYLIVDEIEDWPIISVDECTEPLGLENWEIIDIGEKSLTINCGDDWQDPYEVKLELIKSNKFKVISCKRTEEFGIGNRINLDELIGLVNQKEK